MPQQDFNVDVYATTSATPPMDSLRTTFTGKKVIVIFVIDSTRSMDGERIGAVNSALAEVVDSLRDLNNAHNLDLRVAIMSFTHSIQWERTLTPIEELDVPVIKTRPGNTLYGVAFRELQNVLRTDRFMEHSGKIAAPAIIFMTDGEPDPADDYDNDLDELQKNGWFLAASRSAILIGDAIHHQKARDAVSRFVSDTANVTAAEDGSNIIRQINLATMHTVAGNPGEGYPFHTTSSQSSAVYAEIDETAVPGAGTIPDNSNSVAFEDVLFSSADRMEDVVDDDAGDSMEDVTDKDSSSTPSDEYPNEDGFLGYTGIETVQNTDTIK